MSQPPAPPAALPEEPAPTTADLRVLLGVQRRLATPPVVRTAQLMSHAGEHAAVWIAAGTLGALVDRPRRRRWVEATAGVVAAHGASVVVKRITRRVRPSHPGVLVHAGTPSRFSLPSSHATSTTAAVVAFGALVGRGKLAPLVPAMALSRLVVGVHYPTDVLAGSVLGAVVGATAPRWFARVGGAR
ncbi:phosphatase PAP2 family protein [Kineococcus aurantiacus]|uniref:Membrane-associated phospholipid phosphatase n=1 Tax=Kineococcus aurantiacus TaxID=37633 RepID=A0A7Y9J1R5_9ACTN|nr:phosphatase PAP2 family protein [Kineococcus aurantiacus]NYD23405.1 membrane-associated phospholipid phosphatase [Kineococcus aurantiacus]